MKVYLDAYTVTNEINSLKVFLSCFMSSRGVYMSVS